MGIDDVKKWFQFVEDLWNNHPNYRWIFFIVPILLILYYALKKMDFFIDKKIEKFAEDKRDGLLDSHYLSNIPSKNFANTTYRNSTILGIKSALRNNRVLLSGVGGIGKTFIAIEVFYLVETKYKHAIWINCIDGKSLEESFLESITLFHEIKDDSIRTEKIKHYFTNLKGKTLIVIDNYEQEMMEEEFFKFVLSIKADILVTSRTKEIPSFSTIEISALEIDDCVSLFLYYYNKGANYSDLLLIKELVRDAARHTLSIELLAKSVPPGMDLSKYNETLKQIGFGYPQLKISSMHDDEMLTVSEHLKKLFTVASLSKEQLRILHNMALLPNEEIPFEFSEWINCDVNDLLFLVGKGWIGITDKGYRIHDIIRKTILLDKIEQRQVNEFVNTIARNSFFNKNDSFLQYHAKERYAVAILQNISCNKKNVDAFRHTAKAAMWNGHYCTSIDLYKKTLPIYKSKFGEESQIYQRVHLSLMILYGDSKEYKQSLEIGERLLDIQNRDQSKNEIEIAKTQSYLAFFQLKNNSVSEAIAMGNCALKGMESNLPPEDSEIAIAHCFLGMAYCRNSEYSVAFEHLRIAYQVFLKVYGYKHPRTSSVITGVGDIYYQQHNYLLASKWHLEAYCNDAEIMGDNHPFTLVHYDALRKDYNAISPKKEKGFERWLSRSIKKHKTNSIDLSVLEPDNTQ